MKKQIKKYEIKLFDNLAKKEVYETAPKSFYLYIKKTLRKHEIHLKGRALEAGCGSGTFGQQILKFSQELKIIGVDISSQMVKRANKNKNRYKAICGDLESKNLFMAKTFDVIFCALVLHHFPSLNLVFKNFQKWAKNGSYIIIIEPNSKNIIGSLSKIFRYFFELIFGQNFVVSRGYATPNEIDHSTSTYVSFLKKHHYQNIKVNSGYIRPDIPITTSLGGMRTIITEVFHLIIPFPALTNNFVLITAQKSNGKK